MGKITQPQWRNIHRLLDQDPIKFGLPEPRDDTVILGSFNIIKLGSLRNSRNELKRSADAWRLIKSFCARCDLLAIQEVQTSLEELQKLMSLLGAEFDYTVCDTAGKLKAPRALKDELLQPWHEADEEVAEGARRKQIKGMSERLAFVWRKGKVARTNLAGEISVEADGITHFLEAQEPLRTEINKAFEAFSKGDRSLAESLARSLPDMIQRLLDLEETGLPSRMLPDFFQFERSPMLTSFAVSGRTGTDQPYHFIAINAHLLWGGSDGEKRRWQEFIALLNWLVASAQQYKTLYAPNLVLMGDLNLDFEKAQSDELGVVALLKSLNKKVLSGGQKAKANFPFLDRHPDHQNLPGTDSDGFFKTNARRTETYDHIAFFASDKRLPDPAANGEAGSQSALNYDYGVFDFTKLLSEAVPELTGGDGKIKYDMFKNELSDHLPIWIRLPIPHAGQQEFRWN
ncbi:MAG: hypothetical protein OEM91_05185 [Hyphomicrobiales bacterium]|nr:hypothetical protein [Hyphomicrobiales bacterium]